MHKLIDQIDERFLKALYLMVCPYQAKEPIIGYDMVYTPDSFRTNRHIRQGSEAAGVEYITIEEFQKQSAQWGKPTK
ncbi:MAG: hypothetical protein IPJ40_18045 [Saprospirales bacterium]|nr:hypothetical protein [Saprospirales bacterium]